MRRSLPRSCTPVMRFLRRLLVLLSALLILVVLGAWLTLRGSLPRYEGEVVAPALGAPVTVERDALGSVTVRAGSRNDATWALGYVHAQERFFEMDLLRRRAARCPAPQLARLCELSAAQSSRRAVTQ